MSWQSSVVYLASSICAYDVWMSFFKYLHTDPNGRTRRVLILQPILDSNRTKIYDSNKDSLPKRGYFRVSWSTIATEIPRGGDLQEY
jgi:hypothetical protein